MDYHWGIAENMPFATNGFDAVLCCDVLEHVTDWQKVISEVHRILKINSLFLFDTINKTFQSKLIMIWLLENILKQIPLGLQYWNKFIKPQELTYTMKNYGLNNMVVKCIMRTGKMPIPQDIQLI
nr:methyltransferase domain-containing protein [Nodularia sp. NIES-3585]